MLSKKDKNYFRAAQAVSTLSDFKRVNVGAVLIYKHRIASSSCNSQRTHPLQQKLNKERFEEETLYICRVDIGYAGIAESVLADAGDIALIAVHGDGFRNRKLSCGFVAGRIEYEIVFAVGTSALIPVEHIVDRDEIIVFAADDDLGDVVQPFERRAAMLQC